MTAIEKEKDELEQKIAETAEVAEEVLAAAKASKSTRIKGGQEG